MRAAAIATLFGFTAACAGLWLLFGLGWALLCGGIVLFAAGGVAEAKATR